MSYNKVTTCSFFESVFLQVLNAHASLHKKMKFPADLVTFIEEILNGKLHFFVQCIMKKNHANHAPHMTKVQRKASMKRYQLQNIYFKERTEINKLVYKKQTNFYRRPYKKERRKYYNELNLKRITNNIKFYPIKQKTFEKIILIDKSHNQHHGGIT